eukprot:TRINITY_DN51859_c0_g2_i1.p1 TRINITY_DN51859_c0_g2~~TRINITY_DN51859_c0_g2_i1.p1  ORF type:complete len:151 (+),score=29.25 TRINITY_DN51859_c0_g2_i1:55-507(+)
MPTLSHTHSLEQTSEKRRSLLVAVVASFLHKFVPPADKKKKKPKTMSATLMSREIPPQRAPEPAINPNPQMEIVYTGNTGNDMGISTMGYRSAKYNPSEWNESNYAKFYQSFVDRDQAERVRHESKRTNKETEATTNKTQVRQVDRYIDR